MPHFTEKSAVGEFFINKPLDSGWRFMLADREFPHRAEILSTVDKKLELDRRKGKLERIKKGLMNELLTGKKRVAL
ncbi:MAG: hypothetical protein MUO76_22525 [Anaerolineaceae bacterium]|nr:hypothetical protein [Anaerolineaceae bacterium]